MSFNLPCTCCDDASRDRILGFIGTGQSLSVGYPGPAATVVPPDARNLKAALAPLVWQDAVNVTISADGTLTKTGGGAAWDAGARLADSYTGDCRASYGVFTTGPASLFGLTATWPSPDYTSMNFGLYVAGSDLYVFENGAIVGAPIAYAANDLLEVVRTGSVVDYRKNGVSFRTSPTASAPTTPLFPAVSIYGIDVAVSLLPWRVAGLVPLCEPIRPVTGGAFRPAYPDDMYGESPHTAFARQLAAMSGLGSLHTVCGTSGAPISVIGPDPWLSGGLRVDQGHAYAAGIREMAQNNAILAAQFKKLTMGGILLTHGETDWNNPDYGDLVIAMANRYTIDLTAITGQLTRPIMLLSQQNTYPSDKTQIPLSTIQQWQIGVSDPDKTVCIGPEYCRTYAPDHVHYTTASYISLGEKYAQVYHRLRVLGLPWAPLQPVAVEVTGLHTITITMNVPVSPMVWDPSIPAPHQVVNTEWANGHGFEVSNTSGNLTISSAVISGNTIVLTMRDEIVAVDLQVRYAITQDADGFHGGQADGRVGQLRDSDPFVGVSGQANPNWCVAFSWNVPNVT